MKNEFFDGSRFLNYFQYDLKQMWRNHLRAALGIGLSGLVVYVFWVVFSLLIDRGWQGPVAPARWAVLFFAGLALELYQTRTYGYLTDRRKGMAWLLLPASTFEKWLSMMIMTLIIIPIVFLVAFFGVDSLLCFLDPTCGDSILYSFSNGLSSFNDMLAEANNTYEIDWTSGGFILLFMGSFCCNFLFFLLCGLCFKRHKILYAFVILFVLSLVATPIASLFSMNLMTEQVQTITEAEPYIMNTITAAHIFTWVMTAGLAAGIYYRLRTLKH